MSEYKIQSARQYYISSVILRSDVNNDFYDLLNIYHRILIYESMTHTFIQGKIEITDTNGLIESLPIVGEEKIIFRIKKTASDKKYFEVIGHVYKISNRIREKGKKGVEKYTLEFITPNALINQNQRVSKTYEDDVSKSVEDISKNFLGLSKKNNKPKDDDNPKLYKDIYIEKTFKKMKLNIPNLKPVEAINFLSKFSYSRNTKLNKNPFNTSYRFYQTRQGYFYQSLEKTITENQKNIKHRFLVSNDPNIKYNNKNIDKKDLFTVYDYEFINFYDVFSSSNDGYYGCRNIGYDTLTKSVHKYDLNYESNFNQMTHLEKNNTNSKKFNLNGKDSEKTLILSLPTKKGTDKSEYVKSKEKTKDIFYNKEEKIDVIKRVKTERFNEGIVIEMKIPSNPYLNINDIIYLHFPSYIRENGGKNFLDDKYFSGKYLVVSITHILSSKELSRWEMLVTVLKDSYKSEIR
mgnify:CR=1 FL=1